MESQQYPECWKRNQEMLHQLVMTWDIRMAQPRVARRVDCWAGQMAAWKVAQWVAYWVDQKVDLKAAWKVEQRVVQWAEQRDVQLAV